MEDLITINEEALNKLVLDLYDYSERVNSILNQISDLVNYSSTYFEGQQSDDIIKKYNSLLETLENLKYNISDYSSDLIKVKNKFKNTSSDLTIEVNRQTSNIQSN